MPCQPVASAQWPVNVMNTNSPVCWLTNSNDKRGVNDIVKNVTLAEAKELQDIKMEFHLSLNDEISLEERERMEGMCLKGLKKINNSFYSKNTFSVKYKQPSESLIKLLSPPNMRFFHSISYPVNIILVFFQSAIMNWVFVIGAISSLLVLFTIKRNKIIILIIPPIIFLVVFFGWVHQSNEYRELYTYSSLFLLCPFLVISNLRKWKYKMLFIIISSGVSLYLGFHQMIEEVNW